MGKYGWLVGVLSMIWPMIACSHPLGDTERIERIDRMYQTYSVGFVSVNTIDAADLKLRLSSSHPPVLVDVRPVEERAISMLPGAISEPSFVADMERYRGRTIVVYCTIGARSGVYASSLSKQGFEVFNLRGSLLSWTHAGGGLVDPSGASTKRVHVYGERWNLVADGYQAVITNKAGEVISLQR